MGSGVKTGASGAGAFGALTVLIAGGPSGLISCFGWLGPIVLDRIFLWERKPCAISAERSLLFFNWASPNGLADLLGLEQLELKKGDFKVSQLITNHY